MVTHQVFSLYQCSTCNTLHTEPVPNDPAPYYNSSRYLSHHSQKNDPLSIVYRNIRRVNINNKINIVNSYTSGKDLLDVGCGTGDFLFESKNKGFKVSGVEVDNDARKISSNKNGIEIHAELNLVSDNYDVITLWHVLEHLKDPVKVMHQLHNLTRDLLIIAVPNFRSYDAAYYGNYWAGYDVPRHLFHFCQNSISTLASISGFDIINMHPMIFDAYYVSLLSEKYKNSGRSNIFNAIKSGIRSNRSARITGEYSSLIYILKKA